LISALNKCEKHVQIYNFSRALNSSDFLFNHFYCFRNLLENQQLAAIYTVIFEINYYQQI